MIKKTHEVFIEMEFRNNILNNDEGERKKCTQNLTTANTLFALVQRILSATTNMTNKKIPNKRLLALFTALSIFGTLWLLFFFYGHKTMTNH